MRHDEAVETLLACSGLRGAVQAPSRAKKAAAEEHVARCSDCWMVFSSAYEALVGALPPQSDRMDALFQCHEVQEQLDRLVGLSEAELRARCPDAVRHLSWCHACRGRLADLVLIERSDTLGGVDTAAGTEKTTATTSLHDLVGRLCVRIRRGFVSLAEVPDGFVLVPAPAAALREVLPREHEAEPGASCYEARFTLPGTDLAGELDVRPDGEVAVRLTLRLSRCLSDAYTVHLRTAASDERALLAVQTGRPDAPVVLRQVPPGAYVLEIAGQKGGDPVRVWLDVTADGQEEIPR